MADKSIIESLADEFKAHQLNDSIEFGRAESRDQDAAEARLRIEENIKTLATKGDIAELREALRPLTKAYDGVLFSKKFFLGFVSIILAIGAVGSMIYGFVIWIRDGG